MNGQSGKISFIEERRGGFGILLPSAFFPCFAVDRLRTITYNNNATYAIHAAYGRMTGGENMTFGEKVRAARLAAGYSQRDVSEMTGLSLRTIQNYESGERLPKQRESYTLMSRALNVPIQTLLDESADFSLETQDEHVSRAAGEARRLVDEVSVLYAGGDLCEEDMDAMMRAIQDAYWIAKERGRKFQRRVAENRKDVENG